MTWPANPQQSVNPQQFDHDAGPDAALVGPDDPGRARRLPWAELFKRVFHEDVLVCSKCGGPMRRIAVVQDPAVIAKVLRHLGLWSRGPPRERRVVRAPAALTERPAASVLLGQHGIPRRGLHLSVSPRTTATGGAYGI